MSHRHSAFWIRRFISTFIRTDIRGKNIEIHKIFTCISLALKYWYPSLGQTYKHPKQNNSSLMGIAQQNISVDIYMYLHWKCENNENCYIISTKMFNRVFSPLCTRTIQHCNSSYMASYILSPASRVHITKTKFTIFFYFIFLNFEQFQAPCDCALQLFTVKQNL